MPVVIDVTPGEASSVLKEVGTDAGPSSGGHCSKNGNRQESNEEVIDNSVPPMLQRQQQGYRQLNSNNGSSLSESSLDTSSNCFSSADSSMHESAEDGNEELGPVNMPSSTFNETTGGIFGSASENSSLVQSTSDDNNAADGDDEGESASSLESSLSNYTDCASSFSSTGHSEFKSFNTTAEEDEGPYMEPEGAVQSRRTSCSSSTSESDVSHISQTSCSGGSTGLTTSTSTSESDISVAGLDVSEEPIQLADLSDLPRAVQRENRKNIMKTLQGHAEIITNWSLVSRTDDGRQMWMLLEGKPFNFATKFHQNARPPSLDVSSSSSFELDVTTVHIVHEPSTAPKLVEKKEIADNNDDNIVPAPSSSAAVSAPIEATAMDSSSLPSSETASNVSIDDDEDETTPLLGGTTKGVDENKFNTSASESELKADRKRLLPCGRCDGSVYLINKRYWYMHVIKLHGREERDKNHDILYSCRYCPKQFGLKKSRNAHQKTHEYGYRKPIPTNS